MRWWNLGRRTVFTCEILSPRLSARSSFVKSWNVPNRRAGHKGLLCRRPLDISHHYRRQNPAVKLPTFCFERCMMLRSVRCRLAANITQHCYSNVGFSVAPITTDLNTPFRVLPFSWIRLPSQGAWLRLGAADRKIEVILKTQQGEMRSPIHRSLMMRLSSSVLFSLTYVYIVPFSAFVVLLREHRKPQQDKGSTNPADFFWRSSRHLNLT